MDSPSSQGYTKTGCYPGQGDNLALFQTEREETVPLLSSLEQFSSAPKFANLNQLSKNPGADHSTSLKGSLTCSFDLHHFSQSGLGIILHTGLLVAGYDNPVFLRLACVSGLYRDPATQH